MFPSPRFKAGDSRLSCADTFCNFSLCNTRCCTGLEKFVEELKLFVQSIIFIFYICSLKCAGFKFFVS